MADPTEYEEWAKSRYVTLMKDLKIHCLRAAMMDYEIAANYDSWIFWMEMVSIVLGAISTASFFGGNILSWFWKNATLFEAWRCLLGLFVAAVIYFVAEGSWKVLPSLRSRAKAYNNAAASWQNLGHETASFLIQLERPEATVMQYAEVYDGLIKTRKEICMMADIPRDIYGKYMDADYVEERFKKRNDLYAKLRNQMRSEDD